MMRIALALVLLLGIAISTWAGPLHDAARSGDVSAVEQLLGQGVDVNITGQNDATPLTVALTEQYFSSDSRMASATAFSLIPRPLTTNSTSIRLRAHGGPSSCSPLMLISKPCRSWRFFPRMPTTSMALQAAKEINKTGSFDTNEFISVILLSLLRLLPSNSRVILSVDFVFHTPPTAIVDCIMFMLRRLFLTTRS